MSPGEIGTGRDADLVEVVDRKSVDATVELVEHDRLPRTARSEEQEEHRAS